MSETILLLWGYFDKRSTLGENRSLLFGYSVGKRRDKDIVKCAFLSRIDLLIQSQREHNFTNASFPLPIAASPS